VKERKKERKRATELFSDFIEKLIGKCKVLYKSILSYLLFLTRDSSSGSIMYVWIRKNS